MMQALAVQDAERRVLPPNPKDTAALVIVGRVLDWMAETGDWTYTHAFEATGVEYYNFYRAYKRRAVQAAVADWLGELNLATASLLKKRWLQVVSHMTDIAVGDVGEPRAAVQAAPFLDGVRQSVEEQAKVEGRTEQGVSEARRILHGIDPVRYPLSSGATARARRKTVTEELEVVPDDGPVVIEG